jgi:histidine triad (HIT) family protein
MKDCIFCKIAKDESKSWIVYEDESVKAFLDRNPASEGHTLIIPKKHYQDVYDIPEAELKKIIVIAKRLAKVYQNALGLKAVNILHASGKEAQQTVFHFHVHIIPRHKDDGLDLWYKKRTDIQVKFDETLRKIKKAI